MAPASISSPRRNREYNQFEVWHISNLTTTPTSTLVRSFFPYGTNFNGGVSVGAGDFNGDGYADVVTSPFTNLATQVNVYSGQAITTGAAVGGSSGLINSFSAFTPTETGGSTVSVGDVNGDGVPDIVVAAGLNGQSQVAVMDGVGVASGGPSIAELAGFQVFNSSSTNASGQNILLNASAPRCFGRRQRLRPRRAVRNARRRRQCECHRHHLSADRPARRSRPGHHADQ